MKTWSFNHLSLRGLFTLERKPKSSGRQTEAFEKNSFTKIFFKKYLDYFFDCKETYFSSIKIELFFALKKGNS